MRRWLFLLLLFLPVAFAPLLPSDIPVIFAAPEHVLAAPESWWDEVNLISRLIMGEATGEPFAGQVGVGAVVLNRTRHPQFPNTVPGVIYEPGAFESVSNGLIWSAPPSAVNYRAAELALNGWDPTYGALFFWNPAKPVSPWIWTRTIITQIGSHVFAR
ncbi:MAG TPA: spore cortex-lytic protein [Firmicutes bacterium]|nr:spore cortex-lytic protein [Candidatus Fermentithermobacillaceae bacterium]